MSYQPTFFDCFPPGGILGKDEAHGVEPYVFNDEMAIAVDVALATNRPLLVSGNPGTGKSRLADAIAAVQGWNLLSKTVTSRTRLESLTAEVDHLRRLNDAQVRGSESQLKPDACYLNPGIFWWAFQAETACRRGLDAQQADTFKVSLPFPGVDRAEGRPHHAVLLIDEIDKAEPDVPNDLLELLDRRRFDLPDGFWIGDDAEGAKIRWGERLTLLTVVTTNGERELPQAFLRRCVRLHIPDPKQSELVAIALRHFPSGDANRMDVIAAKTVEFRDRALQEQRRPPGTSEFLDAVRACEELKVTVSEDPASVWRRVESAVLVKEPERDERQQAG